MQPTKSFLSSFAFLGSTIFFSLWLPAMCRAMPPGTLLYRSSENGKMFGYSGDPLLEAEQGIVRHVYAGHAAIYIGREDGVDYVVEAGAGGIVKTPAKYFVNLAEQETFLGARLPRDASPLQRAKAVAIAKSLVGRDQAYDFDFKRQKGPASGDWTCVGLLEKIYESADIANPNNLGALEYDPDHYAVDITPDGYDNQSVVNSEGDCFSRNREFSKIARRRDLLIPAPELIGYDLGLEYAGDRYIFLPYTQFLQGTLEPVAADLEIASSFANQDVRGALDVKALALRWSLINNPVSSLKNIARLAKESLVQVASQAQTLAQGLLQKFFGSDPGTELVLDDQGLQKAAGATAKKTTGSAATAKKVAADALPRVTVNKAVKGQGNIGSASEEAAKQSGMTAEKTTVKKTAPDKAAVADKVSAAVSPVSVQTASTNSANSSSQTPVAPAYYQPVIYTTVSNPASSGASLSGDEQPKIALINKISGTGDNDWIELFNPTDYDFDMAAAGYRLEKTKTADDPSLMIRLGNVADGSYPGGTVIKAHDSYLIVRSTAADFYRVQADALATRDEFNWSGSAYTIYTGDGAISSSADPNIIDAVGFGPDATYFQGNGPAPEITDYYFLSRIDNGEDNRTDFTLAPAPDPAAVAARAALLASSTEAVATSSEETSDTPTSTPETPEIATSTPGAEETPTSTPEIATSTPELAESFALINKIYATGDNDWIELFNPTDYDFDLAAAGYRLEKTKTAEEPSLVMRIGDPEDGVYPGGTVIKAHDSYLIVRDEANSYYQGRADALATRDEFVWTGSGYTVYVGNGPVSSSTDENIIDAVGFGSDATYFRGSGPAPEISDNYFLNRIASAGDNRLDFNLLLADDPSIVLDPDSAGDDPDLDLFIAPTPTISADLAELWHFDECYGDGEWTVGKWDCARAINAPDAILSSPLNPPIDLDGLSLSFYYKKGIFDFPRLNFDLSGEDGSTVKLIIESGLVTVEGLPNSEWRYYLDTKFDAGWHQAVLVVNQAADYWAVYIDGQEIIRENFFARLPLITAWQAGDEYDRAVLDELAFWARPLAPGEILSNYLADAPFAPLVARPAQTPARLAHFWDFEEDTGSLALDSVGLVALHVDPEAWAGRRHDNYALKTIYNRSFTADLGAPLDSRDLSLSFWWRNSAYPIEGRANIHLGGETDENKNLFVLITNYFRLGYWFNSRYGVLSEGINKHIPYDDAWHHLALVYDSYRYKLRFYVDGEEKASSSEIWFRPEDRISRLVITSDSDGSEMDDLGIYEGALSAAQVRQIYLTTK
ncbi:MAG: LamG-like jellyroll fold domain-containing protein [Patescibacteria group bacterium]